MAKVNVAGVSEDDIERAGLSKAERLALEEEPTDVESLRELVEGDDDAGDEDFGDDDAPEVVLPRYRAPAVEGYDEKMAALDTRQVEAVSRFKAGDSELDDLLAEQSRIEAERRSLSQAKLKHEISMESEQQAAGQGWQRDIQTFFGWAKRTKGVDYAANRSLNAALNQTVKDLASAQDKDGNFINDGKSSRWFLREAHRQVMEGIGRGSRRGAGDDDVHGDDRHETRGRADFARLDDLDGLDLEDELSKMTPEEEERWLRAG
jgi:hypothetical protein